MGVAGAAPGLVRRGRGRRLGSVGIGDPGSSPGSSTLASSVGHPAGSGLASPRQTYGSSGGRLPHLTEVVSLGAVPSSLEPPRLLGRRMTSQCPVLLSFSILDVQLEGLGLESQERGAIQAFAPTRGPLPCSFALEPRASSKNRQTLGRRGSGSLRHAPGAPSPLPHGR